MSERCVDVKFYWTPEEAAAVLDYLDRLRDIVWEYPHDDIISLRQDEADTEIDVRQQSLHLEDEIPW